MQGKAGAGLGRGNPKDLGPPGEGPSSDQDNSLLLPPNRSSEHSLTLGTISTTCPQIDLLSIL